MKVKQQPEMNIGMVGHVDHGKTTLTKALSGEWTDRHSEEIKRGISIKLGYADTAFYKCPKCVEPECYSTKEKCPICGEKTDLLRAVSFVDSPGHETLMATMLSGAAIMNGALLLIAANEKCPQPQTKEHLMALRIAGVKNIIVVQNKIDIVGEDTLIKNYEEIDAFIKEAIPEGAPIIPVSAHHDANLDILIQTIEKVIPTPEMDVTKPARMFIARSFDINTPGSRPKDFRGGVIGGSLMQGNLSVGDRIEIAPGREVEEGRKMLHKKMITEVGSLFSGGRSYKKVGPGGLVGIGTLLDPVFTKSDALTGKVVGIPDTLPDIWDHLTIKVHLLDYVVGSAEDIKVEDIKTREPLMLSLGTTTTVGMVTSARGDDVDASLKIPVCAEKGQRVAISRRISGKWRLIGYGTIE
ncbi:MAG: translation initiation factor IF-2 subunit gamma [Methanomassiliicoccales archaeon]|nr:MAG: translation initiation factor IF-2 subunit gamma [Methanomassiliicoccales archaeon]